ncbi:hypothetical protein HPP92_009215 [Vanilla planifolia]|uniref:Uncharacterized protein n=1 Tax=Vanilla planifolia TaxID=51239 RepID=A0A835R3V2_VANPL|nr:hypothetical protein HPP92_009215 [Vanilla planifolia]
MASQKTDLKLAVSAVARGSCTNSDLRYVDCYVDGTALLLDACVSIQDRLASLRHSLRSVRIALHYLENEHEPSGAAVRRAVEALESGDFADGGKPEKYVSKLKAVWKRINEHAMEYKENDDSISPELYKALSGSWAMAVLGIGVLCSATSCRPPVRSIQSQKSDKWGTVVNELSRKTSKMHIKKTDDVATMEELAGASFAAQAILKLVSTSQMLGSNGAMKRVAVKAISGIFSAWERS